MTKQVYGYTEPTMPAAGYVRYTAVSMEETGAFTLTVRNQKGDHNTITIPEGEAEMMARAILDAIHAVGVATAERADDAMTGMTLDSACSIILRHYKGEHTVAVNSLDEPGLPVEVAAAQGFIRNYCDHEGFGAYHVAYKVSAECKMVAGCPSPERCERNGCARDEWDSNAKPHYGRIERWVRFPLPQRKEIGQHLGYMICGSFLDHPRMRNVESAHTSAVVKHDEATGEIETRNSRYTLVGSSATSGT